MPEERYQFLQRIWQERANYGDMRSVLDPNDTTGLINLYIDTMQKAALARYVRFHATDRVLDFGCGIGRISRWLSPRVSQVVGLEVTAGMLMAAKRNTLPPNLQLVQYNGSEIPFRDESFDHALTVGVLQHILHPDHLAHIATELNRVLKKGGTLTIIEQISQTPDHRQDYVRQRLPEEYITLFKDLMLKFYFPVRRHTLLSFLASKGKLPRWCFPIAARCDLWVVRNKKQRRGYTDYLFLFTKC